MSCCQGRVLPSAPCAEHSQDLRHNKCSCKVTFHLSIFFSQFSLQLCSTKKTSNLTFCPTTSGGLGIANWLISCGGIGNIKDIIDIHSHDRKTVDDLVWVELIASVEEEKLGCAGALPRLKQLFCPTESDCTVGNMFSFAPSLSTFPKRPL